MTSPYPYGAQGPVDPTLPLGPTDPWLPPAQPVPPDPQVQHHSGPAPLPPPRHVPPPQPGPPTQQVPQPGPPTQPAGAAGPVVAQVGEIAVTSSTVRTPAGDIPLARSTWQVSDYWQHEQRTPRWAVVAAIAGFCVINVFSLLFLLVKEPVQRGTVQVTVTNGPHQYVARIPVTDQGQVQYVHQQVNYVRSLAAL